MTKFDDLTRRNIRYISFRLQTEATGGAKAKEEKTGIMKFVGKIREHFEEQEDFGGWDKFAKTWDVDEKSPLVAIKRTSSIQTEWNKVLKEETKELPGKETGTEQAETKVATTTIVETSPAPVRDASGKFVSKKKGFLDKLLS